MSIPKFNKRTHRANDRFEMANSRFKWVFNACDIARRNKASWDNHLFCPAEKIEDLAIEELKKAGVLEQFLKLTTSEQIIALACGLMWASWRMTKGIYRFDETLYKALIEAEQANNMPMEVLRRLPEWCVYVETPDLTCDFGTGTAVLHGVWVCFASTYGNELLMIYADVDGEQFDSIMPPCIHINTEAETIGGGISLVMAKNKQNDPDLAKRIENWLMPVFNLLLYLCSDREITLKGKLLEPQNPIPKKTKKGWRLFPAAGRKHWDVGVRIGAAIRKAQQVEKEETEAKGGTVRPHIRRAHWHTFLSGKRKDEAGNIMPADKRKREIKWIPPLPINLDNVEELPAVIKPIKK